LKISLGCSVTRPPTQSAVCESVTKRNAVSSSSSSVGTQRDPFSTLRTRRPGKRPNRLWKMSAAKVSIAGRVAKVAYHWNAERSGWSASGFSPQNRDSTSS